MPVQALDAITGALLIGTWANSFLYTAELMQAWYYFTHFKNDRWQLKTLVSVALLIETLSILGDYACVYLYTITHAGDPVYLASQHWPILTYVFTTGLISVLVQSFLVVRYWNIIVTVLIGFLIIVAFGGSFAVGVIIALFPLVTERNKLTVPATIWLTTEAVTDISISVALLWEYRKAKSAAVQARSVLNRLVAVTIQTGTATSTLAVVTLVMFLLKDQTDISVGLAFTLGRVYMISMFANLNIRRKTGRSAPDTTRAAGLGVSPELTLTTMDTTIGTDDLYNSRLFRDSTSILPTKANLSGSAMTHTSSVVMPSW
ncbi:hypothetical protein GGX14DRAFT_701155 [Mycena pura]|uniref:DUF6534 domain-containing protein n=1 Tax=Mycena pura TaxID=153505 RepID=A0AAD6USE6_9AGAR|nr:hypothetical protein GGX14DRAFT_701155 [Mycena pura]